MILGAAQNSFYKLALSNNTLWSFSNHRLFGFAAHRFGIRL